MTFDASSFITRVAPIDSGIVINVKSLAYGAVGDGINDDTTEIQSAIAAAKAIGATLLFPNGTYKFNGFLFEDIAGMRVTGVGASLTANRGTRFIWDGNSTDAAFRNFGCRDCIFENFTIVSSSTKPLAIAFQSETRSGSPSTANVYRNILIDGTNLNGLGRGFKFIAGTGGNANNAENVFENVQVNNYTNYAWDFQHSQSTAHRFYAVGANAASGATTSVGINSVGGVSYQVYGANINGNGEADIVWPGASNGLTLIGIFSENSTRFLKTTGGSGDTNAPVSIFGGSWNTTLLNADGRVIDFLGRGPLNIEGWALVGDTTKAAAIFFDAGANGTWNFSLKGCLLTTSLTPTTMFTQDQPNRIEDCVFVGSSTVLVPFKSNNVDATPSFETLGVGTSGHSIPTGIKSLIDGVQRLRQDNATTRYRADFQVSSSGITCTIFDDTGAVYKPFIINSSAFEVWPNGVQGSRVQIDANGNLTLVASGATVDIPNGSGKYLIGGTQVVKARETGWTAGTGTANKGAFATYAGQDVSTSYVEAEAQATDNAAKANSERIKAIEDALRAHGLIN